VSGSKSPGNTAINSCLRIAYSQVLLKIQAVSRATETAVHANRRIKARKKPTDPDLQIVV